MLPAWIMDRRYVVPGLSRRKTRSSLRISCPPSSWPLAERLARRAPAAVGAIKRAIHEGGSLPIDKGMQLEQAGFIAAASAPAAKLAMAAYLADVRAIEADGGTMEKFVCDRFPAWLEGSVATF